MRTYERWKHGGVDLRTTVQKEPRNKLSVQEEQRILEVINEPNYSHLPPTQIVPMLADEGVYIASESTFYRVMRKHKQQTHRGLSKESKTKPLETHEAMAPNQVWTWDITWMKSYIQGMYFKLYLIIDIYSRMIVGWEVWEEETSEKAILLIEKAVMTQKLYGKPLVLHSDNGSPMKGATFQATLERLGLVKSYSRPRVSNDNAFSESMFKTLKYCPGYPKNGFESVEDARKWVHQFVTWYNEKHRHSGIRFVTPKDRHEGKDCRILAKRQKVYLEAREKNPIRWSGNTRNWETIEMVTLNPVTKKKEKEKAS